MATVKSFLVLAVLLALLAIAAHVGSAEGWLAGGVFLIVMLFFLSLCAGLAEMLTAPFRNRRND